MNNQTQDKNDNDNDNEKKFLCKWLQQAMEYTSSKFLESCEKKDKDNAAHYYALGMVAIDLQFTFCKSSPPPNKKKPVDNFTENMLRGLTFSLQ